MWRFVLDLLARFRTSKTGKKSTLYSDTGKRHPDTPVRLQLNRQQIDERRRLRGLPDELSLTKKLHRDRDIAALKARFANQEGPKRPA